MKLINDFFHVVSSDDKGDSFTLNPSHEIYRAHFPGNPVTPGVCLIEVVTELMQERTKQPLRLAEVKNIKFLSPVIPQEGVVLRVTYDEITEDAGTTHAKGSITDPTGTTTYTKFSLLFS